MKSLKIALSLLLLLLVAFGVYIATGAYNFAADQPHWRVTEAAIAFARHRSVDLRADDIRVPPDLDAPARLERGAEHYDAMCAGCHLAPGADDNDFRQALYPMPPDLTEHGVHDAADAFWVVKHGIKMTGMPAWGKSHADDALWDIVAFMRAMPSMSADEYSALAAAGESAEGDGGHTEGGGHSH